MSIILMTSVVKSCGRGGERILYGGCDGVGLGADAGDVGEEEDDVRADRDGVEEVATGAGGVITRVKIEAVECR